MSNHTALNKLANTVKLIGTEPFQQVTSAPIIYSAYETAALAIGTSADGYNVKTTGSMFATVTTAYQTIVKNRAGNTGNIIVYLITDNVNGFTLAPGESVIIDNMALVNLFLDSDSSFGALEEVDIILFG